LSKPTTAIFPIENGKLITPLDCNNLQLINLDESNLSGGGGGGGGNDTGTTNAILKGDGAHGFADAVIDIDYASPASVALKEDSTSHDADILLVQGDITTLTASVATKASSASVTAGLALKTDQADFDAYVASNDAAVALKANSTDVTTALSGKADSGAVASALAGKEPLLPTTANDSYILARHNAGAGSAWFFVDPLTLGTTSQTFADGVENSSTTFTSATANFVANDVGKAITGSGIPAATTIASRTNSTTILLSAAATATATGVSFTIVNRVEIGGSGTVTTVGVTNNVTNLLTTSVGNATTSPNIVIDGAIVGANTFYGNATGFAGTASFNSAAVTRTSLGGTTVGQALFQLTNPGVISWARLNADNSVTALSAANTVAALGAENALTFTAPLLRVTNTITIPQATSSTNGYLSSADFAIFTAKAPGTRTISTTAPLTGGGDLSANRTFAIPASTDSVDGYLTAADHTSFTAKPPNSRTISTTAPLTGGGDLSANRTLAIPKADATHDGYLASADYLTFAGVGGVAVNVPVSGALVLGDVNPPITRMVLLAQLTGTVTITLPSAGSGFYAPGQWIEFVDLVTGGGHAGFDINVIRKGTDLIDNAVQITLPRGTSYVRFNSFGPSVNGRWTTTKYFVDSFRDPVAPTKNVTVDVSGQTASAGYKIIPRINGDGYTVGALTPTTGQFVTGLSGDATSGGSLITAAIQSTDIIPNEFVVGNVDDATIPNTGAIDTVKLNASLTGLRLYSFPSPDNYSTGETVRFYASTGDVSTTNFVRVSCSGATFNGNTALDITEPFFNRVFVADPIGHNWTVSTFGGGGGGLVLDTFHTVTPVSGVATIACLNNVVEQHHFVTMSGAITLAFTGANPGMTGLIKFLDTTGNHVVTVPNSVGFTPTAEGTGVFTTSTGTNVIDLWRWLFDGTNFYFTALGKNMVAAAPPAFVTTADDFTTALNTSGFSTQGDSNNFKYGLATKLTANGGVGAGNSYTIGKVRLRLYKTGSPAYSLYVKILADNGAGAPSSTQVGTESVGVATSTLASSEGDIDFSPLATLVSGTVYWLVLHGDNTAVDAANFVNWPFHTTASSQAYRSGSGTVWSSYATTRINKFITYK